MLDIRLPYFYNLPIALLLVMYVVSRVESVLIRLNTWNLNLSVQASALDYQMLLYLKVAIAILPASTAAYYFFRQFYYRHDLYVRETVFILGVVNFLTHFLPIFLHC